MNTSLQLITISLLLRLLSSINTNTNIFNGNLFMCDWRGSDMDVERRWWGDVRLVPLVVVFDRVCWLAVVGCDGWLPWLVISSTRFPRRIDWLVLSVVVCYISVYHRWCIRSLVRVSCTCGEYSWRVFCPRASAGLQTQSKTLQCLILYWSSSSS